MKQIFTLFFVCLVLKLSAQITSVNIPSTGAFQDSTFVIPAGTTAVFNSTNHPGAGPYTNAKILLCQSATLTYDYTMGTSGLVTFYMDYGSTLAFSPQSSGTVAYFNMKGNSTLQIPSTNNVYAYMKRESNVNLAGMPITMFTDSVYTTINFTFNGWMNPCLATPLEVTDATHPSIQFQNPIDQDLHIVQNSYSQEVLLTMFNEVGQCVGRHTITQNTKHIPLPDLKGLIFYTLSNKNGKVQSGKLFK